MKDYHNKPFISSTNMKNILIVNTRSSERKLSGMVMWGAWAVSSYFKKSIPGSDVMFLDENNEDDFKEKFEKILPSRDTVGFSITSMQIKYTLPLAQYIKKNYRHIKIILGGIHPILFPNDDYGNLFDEVVTCELPKNYFLYDLLPEKVNETYRKKRAQVVTGFNCSFKCAFCVNSVRNCRYEGVPAKKALESIDYVVKEFNPPKIYFRDEDFFQDFKKARKITDYLIEKKYGVSWEASSRVIYFRDGWIDDDFLRKLVKAGCRQLRFGVESGSQRVLNYLRKGQTVEQIKYAVRQCVKYGIRANCSVMTGIPTETAEEREETYKLLSELAGLGNKVEILGPQIYRPYPGGILYEEAKKYGFSVPQTFKEWAVYYDENPLGDVFDAEVSYPWLTEKENKQLPFTWVIAHYGLNYGNSPRLLKRMIGTWFKLHWKLRWFGGPDIRFIMFLRKKFFKSDLD